jgi:hypothetical protein
MYALFKGQAAVAPTNPGLFGEERKAPAQAEDVASSTARVGGLGRLRSSPPGERPN